MTPQELEVLLWVGAAIFIVMLIAAIFVAKKGKRKPTPVTGPSLGEPDSPINEVETVTEEEGIPDPSEVEEDTDKPNAKHSVDMTAKEAIDYIKNHPLESLGDFITGDETRVTVQRAWNKKQRKEDD